MKLQIRRKWQVVRQYMIGWSLAFLFFTIVHVEGMKEIGSVPFHFWQSVFVSVAGGVLFGAISGYAQVLTEERAYKKMSIQRLLLLRIAYVILFLFAMIALAFLFFGSGSSFFDFAFEPGSFAIYLFIVLVDIFLFCLRQVNLFFGRNNLWRLFRGAFYTPREEERIFMFLDLQSSTTHAERLGHIRFSKLIQDCFNDLGVVVENEAEIYQYVGDEAILSWNVQTGLDRQNCLNAFYNFKKELNDKQDYYTIKYDCLPRFKAGVNVGLVTATEVGKYKKEIAYHGDTLNTAARIQGKCNEFNQELLISGSLKELLNGTPFKFEEMGSLVLKGKEQQTQIYGVSQDI